MSVLFHYWIVTMLAFAFLLVMQAPPYGDMLPPAYLGSYASSSDQISCSEMNLARVTITKTTFSNRGEHLPILLIEKVSNRDWYIWVKARAENVHRKVEEIHLNWGDDDYLVISSNEGEAEAILQYGKPVADAGIWGAYELCK